MPLTGNCGSYYAYKGIRGEHYDGIFKAKFRIDLLYIFDRHSMWITYQACVHEMHFQRTVCTSLAILDAENTVSKIFLLMPYTVCQLKMKTQLNIFHTSEMT